MKKHLEHLLQKYKDGKISLKEQIELSQHIADEQDSYSEEVLLDDWQKHVVSDFIPNRNMNPILDRVHHRIRLNEGDKKIQASGWQTFQRIAAVLFFPLLLSFMGYFYFQSEKATDISYAEIQCPMGVRTKFKLPDGSIGYLNSGARLKYPVQFADNRKVELTGEAFFDVVHNEKAPFHVNTRNLDIKVLGTTFNVIANEDEPTEEIVLQTGQIDVSSVGGKNLTILKPNEHLTLDIAKRTFVKNEVISSQYTTWKEGKLVFRNENMQQVARRLSRWYNAEIVLEDNQLDSYTFHATFIDEQLDEVLKLLSITTPISYFEEKRTTDNDGIYNKRKLFLRINKSKISQFN